MSSLLEKSQAVRLAIAAVAVWTAFLVWAGYLLRSAAFYHRTYFRNVRTLARSPIYHLGDVVNYTDDKKMLFVDWSDAEPGFRWSDGHQAGFVFRLEGGPRGNAASKDAVVRLRTACSLGWQPVGLRVNDRALANFVVNGKGEYAVRIPPGLMHNGANSLEFTIPGAQPPPGNADPRVLGICLKDLTILPEGGL